MPQIIQFTFYVLFESSINTISVVDCKALISSFMYGYDDCIVIPAESRESAYSQFKAMYPTWNIRSKFYTPSSLSIYPD